MFIATGCFIGNLSVAPGTFGSILGLPLCFILAKIELTIALFFTITFIFFAIIIAQKAEKILVKKDPGCIIIDEIAGLMVALIGLPFNIISVTAGFIIFRAFDIFKPYPIRYLEEKLPGGVAIVMDDVAAGIYSNIVLRMGIFFLN
jgi:phosphatidylglycerophosphatase A